MSWLGPGLPSDGDLEASRRSVPGYHEERRAVRTRRLCGGTLACDRCDAPVTVGAEPLVVADPICCPFCGRRAAVREFLSLEEPTRPARVTVRLSGLP
ncbi:MAG: hypothetical protein JOZ07_16460 [Solirubrobacterales bacterium]|nr:hypothetical protein [Solirubrobacterales bacterium]